MKKIAFLGSKDVGYAALNYLIENADHLDIGLVAVLSNDRKSNPKDKSVLELAYTHQIPVLTHTDQLLELEEYDFLISVQYHEIIKQKHIDTAKKIAVNLHMAPLPEYRGCNQFSFAIIDQAKEFGTTLHIINSGIDSGDILFENRFSISSNETVISLHEKTNEHSIQLFKNSIEKVLSGTYTRTPQKELYSIRSSNFHLRNEIHQIKQINPEWDEEKIDRYVRATYFPPFPPPFMVINGHKIDLSLNWRNEIPR
jgi:methionyl-tRNA formyltransferase